MSVDFPSIDPQGEPPRVSVKRKEELNGIVNCCASSNCDSAASAERASEQGVSGGEE